MIIIPIIIAILIVIYFYRHTVPEIEGWRKYLLISLRAIVLIILIFLLFNPILKFISSKIKNARIILLDDVSQSMELMEDNESKTTKLESFRKAIEKKAKDKNYQIKTYEFAQGLDGGKNSTELTRTLEELATDSQFQDVEAIYLLSDGWFKDDELQAINNLDIPIHSFDPGSEIQESDLALDEVKYNKVGYKNEATPLHITVKAQNFQKEAELILSQNNNVLQTKKLDFSKEPIQTIELEQRFISAGLKKFTILLKTDLLQETNLDNNEINGAIQIKEQKTNILLLSETLNWDVKFIIDVIQKNPRWHHEFLLKRDRFTRNGKIVDLADMLQEVAVIVIINTGNFSLQKADRELIANYLDQGGGLLSCGKVITALANYLPANDLEITKTFKSTFRLTEESQRYHSFSVMDNLTIEDIPPVEYFYTEAKLQAKILARMNNQENSPAILLNVKGNLLQFTFLNLWKWQLWSEEGKFSKFISDILQWLGQKASERFVSYPDKNAYYAGETVKVILQAFDEKLAPIRELNAKLTLFDEKDDIVLEKFLLAADDEYFLKINSLSAGDYHYEIESSKLQLRTKGEFIVNKDNPENFDIGFNIPLLSYISSQTKGDVLTEKKLADHSLDQASSKSIEIKNEIPIYKKWYFIALFISAFCLELYLRKRWGLL